MITVKSLYKSYGKNEILKGINLSFEKGKVYGVVGRNGAGKTTLFNCISGIEKYKGEVVCEQQPLKDYLGYLQTESHFYSRITGEEYIRLFCNARGVTVDDMEKSNLFNLPLNEYASNYSTGMKKKLALLALLLQKNDYYILDEPYNGVDLESNILISEIIKKLRELGKIVIISSHIFSTLEDVCDEICLLDEGKISNKYEKENFKDLSAKMQSEISQVLMDDIDL